MEIVIKTERLYLRKFTVQDGDLIIDLNSNPEVMKYLHEPTTSKDNVEHVMNNIILPQYKLYNHGRWAVHLKADNSFIGWCGLKFVQERGEIDLGYRFKENYWGKGYATEAAKAVLDYGFHTLHMKKITVITHVDNLGSQNVINKLGFVFTKESFIDGCPVKCYEMERMNGQKSSCF